MNILSKKPIKNPKLSIIEHVGGIYATINREKFWEIDRSVAEVLKMCDGKKTIEQIARRIASIIDEKVEKILPILMDMLNELEKNSLITYED